MTPLRMKEILDTLGWTPTSTARRLGCTSRLVRRWLGYDTTKGASIPTAVAEWLEAAEACHKTNPAPTTWKRTLDS